MLKCVVTVLLCANVIFALSTTKHDFELAKEGMADYILKGATSDSRKEALMKFQMPHVFLDENDVHVGDDIICGFCDLAVTNVILARQNGTSKDDFLNFLSELCTVLNIESSRVCSGFLGLNIDTFLYIIDNKANLTSERVCGSLLQSKYCDKGDNFEWEIVIPDGSTVPKPQRTTDETFQIAHISDFHFDPVYTPGKTAACGEPLCCQYDQDDAEEGAEDYCGHWSHYSNADIPEHMVYESVRQVNTHEFDYAYYTGDIISHRVWSTSQHNNTIDITTIFGILHDKLAVPVYPVLGNHEPSPMNLYIDHNDTDGMSTSWLFELSYELWLPWLSPETAKTIIKGGYYTISPRPGFRIVALNSNVCYTVNWWLIYEDYDPYGQLAWLVEVLLEAEKNGEAVHILGHVPSGQTSCIAVWSREYRKIVDRFANTIKAQFNGHTHKDEFHIYYNRENSSEAVNVAFNGASVTTYTDVNPSYKIYQVNKDTFTVDDYEEWTFNLTQANLEADKTPAWYKLYSFKEAYGVKSLDPSDMSDLLYRMAENHTLIELYNNFHFRNSDPVVKNGCNDDCQKDHLCSIAATQFGDDEVCLKLLEIWENNKMK